ncbi:MAG: ChaN family lipoprotein [Synechococcaceae cyanobacterium]
MRIAFTCLHSPLISPWFRLVLLPLLLWHTASWAADPAISAPSLNPPDCAAAEDSARLAGNRLQANALSLDALLLGEIHTSAADHAWQLQTLDALAARRPRLALGLEMVPAPRQPVLDRFSVGQLDEAAFLREVGWAEVWGHDPELYLPILRWARARGVPLLALNAEPELVRRVRREGLAAIPPAQWQAIGKPAPLGAAYRARLERSWRAHGGDAALPGAVLTPTQAADLERFLDSQRLRDRAMAVQIAAAHQRDPAVLVVALIGRGHLEDHDGVPRQLRDLGLTRLEAALRPELPPACAPAPAGARLGAYLESADGVVWVRQVAPGTAAARGGLRVGDRILTVNDQAVDRAGQVIRRVRLQPDGEPLRLSIERGGRRLRLELQLPPRREPLRARKDNGLMTQPPAANSARIPS